MQLGSISSTHLHIVFIVVTVVIFMMKNDRHQAIKFWTTRSSPLRVDHRTLTGILDVKIRAMQTKFGIAQKRRALD